MTALPAIRTEGGLLGPDLLDQVAASGMPGQKPTDFGLKPGRSLTDEIAAAYADARALWGVFQNRLNRLSADDPATTATRDAWVIPLLGVLGYDPKYNPKAFEVDGLTFAVSHRADEAEDSPPIHIVGARQDLGRLPPAGRPRLAPHTLLQEFLNRTERIWGIVTNGLTLRLLRDSKFIRRQAYVEFDLQAICEGQRFPDFAVFYRLLHRTRLPRRVADAGECLLEKYHEHSVEQGGRVREHLRDGVEECLKRLANGFLAHPANDDLRRRLGAAGGDRLSAEDLYRQLLRLVYRFLFLLVSEDRGLLSTEAIYREYYSVSRLRRLVDRRAAFTDHDDLWYSLRVLWRILTRDDPQPSLGGKPMASALGLTVLNGDLFARQDLDDCTLTNRDLLGALWHLCWYQEKGNPPRRVNYAALDVEELGSVYESLLEFHPTIDITAGGRSEFQLLRGSERKTTGSYYTPPELVGELIRSALEPVIADRLTRPEKERLQALLSLRVCDPACGSGHFLLAAARRIGREVAKVRTGADEPGPDAVRAAVREVICHCIYGVDKNPLAVDLCRVALWLEGHTADNPLTFLDHRIRCGDSLVGVSDLTVVNNGIPDKAFDPLEGDDRALARRLAKRNKDERRGQGGLFDAPSESLADFTAKSRAVDAVADDSPEAIRSKRQLFEDSHADLAWRQQKLACDLWTSAFFQPLVPDAAVITTNALRDHLAGRQVPGNVTGLAEGIGTRQRFFHWPLEFPEVFADGGFDVILSNPPWEHVELKQQEFFAARDVRIASAATKAERTKLIATLPQTNPQLYDAFSHAQRGIGAVRLFLGKSGRYPLTGHGRINTFAVFAELDRQLLRGSGRAGVILPTGIATDYTTRFFFADLVRGRRLQSFFGFKNERFLFPLPVEHTVTFGLLTMLGDAIATDKMEFTWLCWTVAEMNSPARRVRMSGADFALLNPNTGNSPVFRTQADAELTKAVYRHLPLLWNEGSRDSKESNPWEIGFSQGLFNMASDSRHFRSANQLENEGFSLEGNVFVSDGHRFLPLYEAKMLHQFDHRYSTYEGATRKQINAGTLPQSTANNKRNPAYVVQPRYWVQEDIVASAIPVGWTAKWFLGWRDVCRSTDTRTMISTVVPRTAVGDKFLLVFAGVTASQHLSLLACFDSFIFDYITRQKLGGTALKYFIVKQLPVIHVEALRNTFSWLPPVTLEDWLKTRVLELTYTASGLESLALDCGCEGPPFVWNDDRRFVIRSELDAAFFHIYLPADVDGRWQTVAGETSDQIGALTKHFPTPRDAVRYVMDQFPLVQKKDEAVHNQYRTKAQILEVYDAMQSARRTGRPYVSPLDPPPGDPRAAHPR